MDWTQFTIFFISVFCLFIWNRSESNSDRRDIMNLIKAIEKEMKDFHGRLCALEEKNKK